jgi:hypothetical protein
LFTVVRQAPSERATLLAHAPPESAAWAGALGDAALHATAQAMTARRRRDPKGDDMGENLVAELGGAAHDGSGERAGELL